MNQEKRTSMARETLIIINLPPELILNIFRSLDNFRSVNALVRTSRIFYHTWLSNPASISDAVLPRVVYFFEQASKLVHIQERLLVSNTFQENTPRNAVILRTKRFLINERNVSTTCDWLNEDMFVTFREEAQLFFSHRHPPHFTVTERLRVAHACYQIWIIASLQDAHFPDGYQAQLSILENMNLRELKRLVKLINWLIASARNERDEEDKSDLLQLVPGRCGLDRSWIDAAANIYQVYQKQLEPQITPYNPSGLLTEMYTFIDDHFTSS